METGLGEVLEAVAAVLDVVMAVFDATAVTDVDAAVPDVTTVTGVVAAVPDVEGSLCSAGTAGAF